MNETIELIVRKYYQTNDEYYFNYRYDENESEFEIGSEIKTAFEENPLINQFSILVEECFDSCGYSSDMLMIAWIEDDKLKTFNLLLECM